MVLEMAGSIKVCLYIELRLITKNHVQEEKGAISGLWLLILESSACKIGPWLASGNLDFKKILIISRTDRSMLKLYLDSSRKH